MIADSKQYKIFERFGVDCIGPLPKTSSGFQHIILATDYATGYVEGLAVRSKHGIQFVIFSQKILF